MRRRSWIIVLFVASYLGVCVLARNPDAHASRFAVQDKRPTKLYFGVTACSNSGCHDNPMQKEVLTCDYDEVRIWSKFDKHKDANTVLNGARARQMAKLLGIKGDIAKARECISCHGVLIEDDKLKHSSFRLEDGVSCVACHGAYKEWVGRHSDFLERDEWRKLSRQAKEEQFGMRDLWDPEKRATLCASCHIGSAAEGKVVTHAMYAAGHPPLPGFEPAFFSDAMPRHWKYPAEKSPKVQAILGYDPAKADLERTRLVVIGGLVSLRESMHLLVAQAEADGGKHWPEFASFDCYACHHDLKTPSWRQQRGYTGKPGRPPMRAWPTELAHLSRILEPDKKMGNETLNELAGAFAAQPFGDRQKVALAAKKTGQWADATLARLRTTHFDHAAAERIVAELGTQANGHLVDFDSARQLAWALRSIRSDFPKGADRPEDAVLWKDLDEHLKLELPKGQVEIGKDFLRESLDRLNNYDPQRFARTFARLVKRGL